MMSEQKEKSQHEQLSEKLVMQPRHVAVQLGADGCKNADEFAVGYKRFLDEGKTEREAAATAVSVAETFGYTPFERKTAYRTGDRAYFVNRGKSVIFVRFGSRPVSDGLRIAAAHIDAPRLDLKPNPLYEDSDIALFKTHYYGGIKKYQWTAIPLALHGVVCTADGRCVTVKIGEAEDDPKFCITDLLPHLAKDQSAKPLREAIAGEDLNIVVGSMPVDDEKVAEKVKLAVLEYLNREYGLIEADFLSAELEIVPAFKACDVGFDRSFIGAYGHDDRVCAYTALMAQMDAAPSEYTCVTVLADKEEIGSVGATGLNSDYVKNFISNLAINAGADYYEVVSRSSCLSADVNAAFDPTFASVSEKRNNCQVNRGVVMTKYTGHGGKSGSNDSSAEFCGKMRRLFDAKKVPWQIGELGRVDQGGGGTVALYIAGLEMDVVDVGVPVLSMHAPFELVTRGDVYATYQAFKAFFEAPELK